MTTFSPILIILYLSVSSVSLLIRVRILTVAERRGLIVGIDKYLDPKWGAVPYAEIGAGEMAKALGNSILLLGPQATKTIVESKVRTLKKSAKAGDTLVVWFAGRGLSKSGRGHLAAWDTQPDDPLDTSLSLRDLLKELSASKASHIVLLLDVGVGHELAGFDSHLDEEELEKLFADSAKAVCVSTCTPGEESTSAGNLKAGTATRLILDALTGQVRKAATKVGTVTALTLSDYLADELPRSLRKHFDHGVRQSPRLYGDQNAGAVLIDLAPLLGSGNATLLDPERLKRVVFRTESGGRVKELAGFRKSFQLPEIATPSARKFIAKCATDDLREDLNRLYESAREHLGYKRKDIDTAIDAEGTGTLRTPDFEYTIRLTLDKNDPTQVTWRREVGAFSDPGFLRGPGFKSLFGNLFDQLVFEFDQPVDVEAWIDRLEDNPQKGVKLHIESDGTACEITLAGLAGRMRIERSALTVRGRGHDSAGLLDQFLAFLRDFGGLGERLKLKA